MPVLQLQKIVLENLSLKDISRMHNYEKGIVSRIFVEYLNNSESVELFKNALAENGNHICRTKKFNVWHGMNIGPRKFRNKTLCKCVCEGTGNLCCCECDSVIKMLIEYRENEVFRGYTPMQKSHKKARRFIPKRTSIKDLFTNQFQDPHPYQRQ